MTYISPFSLSSLSTLAPKAFPRPTTKVMLVATTLALAALYCYKRPPQFLTSLLGRIGFGQTGSSETPRRPTSTEAAPPKAAAAAAAQAEPISQMQKAEQAFNSLLTPEFLKALAHSMFSQNPTLSSILLAVGMPEDDIDRPILAGIMLSPRGERKNTRLACFLWLRDTAKGSPILQHFLSKLQHGFDPGKLSSILRILTKAPRDDIPSLLEAGIASLGKLSDDEVAGVREAINTRKISGQVPAHMLPHSLRAALDVLVRLKGKNAEQILGVLNDLEPNETRSLCFLLSFRGRYLPEKYQTSTDVLIALISLSSILKGSDLQAHVVLEALQTDSDLVAFLGATYDLICTRPLEILWEEPFESFFSSPSHLAGYNDFLRSYFYRAISKTAWKVRLLNAAPYIQQNYCIDSDHNAKLAKRTVQAGINAADISRILDEALERAQTGLSQTCQIHVATASTVKGIPVFLGPNSSYSFQTEEAKAEEGPTTTLLKPKMTLVRPDGARIELVLTDQEQKLIAEMADFLTYENPAPFGFGKYIVDSKSAEASAGPAAAAPDGDDTAAKA